MAEYYDDNFGRWDMDDEESVAFYNRVQRESVLKICKDCGQEVRLLPQYAICDSCAVKRERGYQW